MTTATDPTQRESQLEIEFEQRFSNSAKSIYSDRFRKLLEASSKRFHAQANGEPYEVDESIFSEDVRSLRQSLLSDVETNDDLPSLPMVVRKLDDLLAAEDAAASDVAAVVRLDAAITARLLKLLNSSYYPLTREVTKLEEAVAYLGLKGVRNIVLSASVLSTFSDAESDLFSPSRFWEHSLAVATASSLIARTMNERGDGQPINCESAYLAGLVHDIGKIIIAQYYPSGLEQIGQLSSEGLSSADAEMAVLSLHHTDFGFQLLTQWGLPPEICKAALSHHDPVATSVLAYVVHLADSIAHGLGFSADKDAFPRLDPRVWATLDLADREMRRIGFQVLDSIDEALSLLGR